MKNDVKHIRLFFDSAIKTHQRLRRLTSGAIKIGTTLRTLKSDCGKLYGVDFGVSQHLNEILQRELPDPKTSHELTFLEQLSDEEIQILFLRIYCMRRFLLGIEPYRRETLPLLRFQQGASAREALVSLLTTIWYRRRESEIHLYVLGLRGIGPLYTDLMMSR